MVAKLGQDGHDRGEALKAKGADDIIVVAGGVIPRQDYQSCSTTAFRVQTAVQDLEASARFREILGARVSAPSAYPSTASLSRLLRSPIPKLNSLSRWARIRRLRLSSPNTRTAACTISVTK